MKTGFSGTLVEFEVLLIFEATEDFEGLLIMAFSFFWGGKYTAEDFEGTLFTRDEEFE